MNLKLFISVQCLSLFSVLAEEFHTNKEIYEQAAKDDTAVNACQSMEFIEKVLYNYQDMNP